MLYTTQLSRLLCFVVVASSLYDIKNNNSNGFVTAQLHSTSSSSSSSATSYLASLTHRFLDTATEYFGSVIDTTSSSSSSTTVTRQQQLHHRSLQDAPIIRVTKLFLVDTDTKQDLFELVDGSSYDILKLSAKNLTIRAETTETNGCGWVVFKFDDGKIEHTDLNSPFTLVGNDTDGSLFPSASLKEPGKHTLLVQPSTTGSSIPDPNAPADLPVQETPVGGFKSCWALPVVSTETSLPDSGINTTSLSDAISQIRENSNIFSRKATDRRHRRGLVEEAEIVVDDQPYQRSSIYHYTGRRKLQSDVDDGSLFITFYVKAGTDAGPPEPEPTPVTDYPAYTTSVYGSVQGILSTWNKITIGFIGPVTTESKSSERGPYGPLNTFQDFRLDVTFTHMDSKTTYVVPGYFDLDGNSANYIVEESTEPYPTNVWVAHFVPALAGNYTWTASFRIGTNSAPNGGGDSGGHFDGAYGSFEVTESQTVDPPTDLRNKGKLRYVTGSHYFQFAKTGDYFLKVGPESPQNFLAYSEFDDTTNNGNYSKSYSAHVADYTPSGYTWAGGKGKGIIGALDYLASKGVNVISVTALTVDGVDKNVYPLVDPSESKVVFDVSKLAQWNVVFEWASRKGIVIKFKFNDAGSDDFYDGGLTAEDRKTYYREIIARFGHNLGIIWDLGEDITDVDQIKARATYIRTVDPYNSPIVVQTLEAQQEEVYSALLNFPAIDGISIASADFSKVGTTTAYWYGKSESAGKAWVISSDEQGAVATGVVPDSADLNRANPRWALYGNLLNGGAGVQFYFGSSEDVTAQDFHTRDTLFTQAALAKQFFIDNKIPLADVTPSQVNGISVLTSKSKTLVVAYKPPMVASIKIDLPTSSKYSVTYFNPRTGATTDGVAVTGGSGVVVGPVPNKQTILDWVVLLQA